MKLPIFTYGQFPLTFINLLLCTYCIGIYCGYQCSPKYLFFALILLILAAIISVWQRSRFTWLIIPLLMCLLGIFRLQPYLQLPASNISNYYNQELTIYGQIISDPKIKAEGDINRLTYIVKPLQQLKDKQRKILTGDFYLHVRQPRTQEIATQGAKLIVTGKLKALHGYHNPGQINSELLAQQSGIYGRMSTNPALIHYFLHTNTSLTTLMSTWRTQVSDHLLAAMSPNDAAVLYAMVFGGYSNIDKDLLQAFTLTGIVHILSVSGSHISLLIAFLLSLCKTFHLPHKLYLLLVLAFITLYTLLCGAVPPVLRASIMGLLALTALYLKRQNSARQLLSLTALGLLLYDPLLLYHISFQLSFAATAGLIYLTAPLQHLLKPLPQFIKDNLAITIGAQVATLPILAWYFNSVSLVSLLANLLATPILEFIIIGTMLGSGVFFLSTFLGKSLLIACSQLLGLANAIIYYLAGLSWATIYLPTFNFIADIIYYACLLLLIKAKTIYHWLKLHANIMIPITIISTIILALISLLHRPVAQFSITAVDVHQGDCMVAVTPHGHTFIFDCGGILHSDFDIGSKVLVPYLLHQGLRNIDYIFLSHAHEDHSQGARAVLAQLPVKRVFTAGEPSRTYARSMQLAPDSKYLRKFQHIRAGQRFKVDGVTIDCIYVPPPDFTSSNDNEMSAVYKVTYGKISFLITGDLTKEHEAIMLQQHLPLKSTVLKVAHHGSDTSNSPPFLRAVRPRFSVICVGPDNKFGHPKDVIIQRLHQLHIPIYRTDIHGATTFTTDGRQLNIHTYCPS